MCVCILDLVIRHIILPFADFLVVSYLSTLSHKRQVFRKEKLLNLKCNIKLLWSSTFLVERIIQRDVTESSVSIHIKYSLFLSDFNPSSFFFLTDLFKSTQMSNFNKIRPLAAELLYADGRTNMTKLIFNFYCSTVHFDICRVHSPTKALLLI